MSCPAISRTQAQLSFSRGEISANRHYIVTFRYYTFAVLQLYSVMYIWIYIILLQYLAPCIYCVVAYCILMTPQSTVRCIGQYTWCIVLDCSTIAGTAVPLFIYDEVLLLHFWKSHKRYCSMISDCDESKRKRFTEVCFGMKQVYCGCLSCSKSLCN